MICRFDDGGSIESWMIFGMKMWDENLGQSFNQPLFAPDNSWVGDWPDHYLRSPLISRSLGSCTFSHLNACAHALTHTHTCSELHFELLKWNASYVQNNNVTWKVPELPSWVLNVWRCGSFGWRSNRLKSKLLKSAWWFWHGGSWVSHVPFGKIVAGTSGWSVPISSQLMSSFVGSGLMSGPLPPAKKIYIR